MATAPTSIESGIMRFATNVPVNVALKFDEGKPVEGQYGDQVLYTLCDDRRMYVSPIVAKKITELGIRAREEFVICKSEKRLGNRKGLEWQVYRPTNPPVSIPAASAPHPLPPQSMPGPIAVAKESEQSGNAAADLMPAKMRSCLIEAIEAVIGAEAYALSRGSKLQFTSEDICSLGISIYMQATGRVNA